MASLITPTSFASPAAVLAGVASHLLFFKHGERHLYPFHYVQFYLLSFAGICASQSHFGNKSLATAARELSVLAAFHFAGLFASLIVYRLLFNPLNKIPGPIGARLSKFSFVLRVAAKQDSYLKLTAMHQKYGPFVRIGPNDLSVADANAVLPVLGPGSKCTKSQWYSQDTPLISMHTTRDRATHDRRRRIWAPAFSDKALRGYESRIQQYNDLFLDKIGRGAGHAVNASVLFNLYSFDVMGELGFGQSFDMIESGQEHWAIKLLNAGMDPMGFGFPPWVFRVLIGIPGAARDYYRFINFCCQRLEDRMREQGKTEHPDVTHTLIEHFEKLDAATQKETLPMLQGDSRLIIVAGSDTTAATLTHLFYHLAAEPELVSKVRQELGTLTAGDGAVNHARIQDARLLTGCINEALRLHPPVPSGVFRKTPKEGLQIGETYIPGDTVIQIPNYVIGRDESCFPHATQFSPERWSTSPDMIRNPDAFAPFSIGPYGCIGKNLAYMEIRLLTAQILLRYDVKLAAGEDGSTLLMRSADHFTLGLGKLDLVFEPRKG